MSPPDSKMFVIMYINKFRAKYYILSLIHEYTFLYVQNLKFNSFFQDEIFLKSGTSWTAFYLGLVHTYLDILGHSQLFLSGYDFRLCASPKSRYFLICSPEKKKKKSATKLITCGRWIWILWIWLHSNILYSLLPTLTGSTTCRPSFSRVNPETIGCMSTGKWPKLAIIKQLLLLWKTSLDLNI